MVYSVCYERLKLGKFIKDTTTEISRTFIYKRIKNRHIHRRNADDRHSIPENRRRRRRRHAKRICINCRKGNNKPRDFTITV